MNESLETITGKFVRDIFHRDDRSFCIYECRTDDDKSVKCVGANLAYAPGVPVIIYGTWTRDKRGERQFTTEFYEFGEISNKQETYINYQNHVLVAAQDIDMTVALMCYIQLSLLGVAGYVKIGNSITDPITDIL